jgi:hypothetical protein
MRKTVYCMLLFLMTAAGTCLAQSDQPSLGDVARKLRGEKKTTRTFSNEDVATTHPSVASDSTAKLGASVPSSTGATANSSAKPDAKADIKNNEPASTSKDTPEVAELKNKISSYKVEQDGWKRSAKRNEDLLANETSDFRRQMYQDQLEGDRNNVQLYQNKIDQAQADLAQAQKAKSGR